MRGKERGLWKILKEILGLYCSNVVYVYRVILHITSTAELIFKSIDSTFIHCMDNTEFLKIFLTVFYVC